MSAELLFARHRARFEAAREACRTRACWSPFPDMPARYPDAEAAQARGLAAFQAHCGTAGAPRRFVLEQPGTVGELGEEVSPYTQQPLHIRYPQADIDTLFSAATAAMAGWAEVPAAKRLGVLMEVVDVLYREHLFEIASAVQHTAGQSANMAYAGSGVNALDRAIEALVYAEQALQAVAPAARWERPFGSTTITLDKT